MLAGVISNNKEFIREIGQFYCSEDIEVYKKRLSINKQYVINRQHGLLSGETRYILWA